MFLPPPRPTLFPYTTLFRSPSAGRCHLADARLQPHAVAAAGQLAPQESALSARGARRSRKDRKSTRLNSSHRCISYAVFCLKKKKDTKMEYISVGLPHGSSV